MATVVPVSHSQRWRSRSRNQSADVMSMTDLQIHVPVDRDDNDDDDDEEREFDDLQTSPWLVVPQGFVSPVQQRTPASHPASPAHSWQKALEMRRAVGF